MSKPRRWPPSKGDIAEIRRRLKRGENQHDIAADFGVNQGRISEINTGKIYRDPPSDFPSLF